MHSNIVWAHVQRIERTNCTTAEEAAEARTRVQIFSCDKDDADMNAKFTHEGNVYYLIIYVNNYRIQQGKVRECIVEEWNCESSGTWEQYIKVQAPLSFTYEKDNMLYHDRGLFNTTITKKQPEIPVAPFNLYARVWREKYHGTCCFVNREVKKGQPLPIHVEYGHHWRFYPDRTKYAKWGTTYYYKLSDDGKTDISSYRELKLEWN